MPIWRPYFMLSLLILGTLSLAQGKSLTPQTVRAKPGDTLSRLARQHGTSVARLVQLNHLKTTRLLIGQTVRLRPAPPAARRTSAARKGTPKRRLTAKRGRGLPRRVWAAPRPPRRPSVRLVHATILGVHVLLVEVDLRDPHVLVTPVLPRGGLGTGAALGTLARQAGATALINGGYFHPTSFIPAGDLVVHGRYIASGRVPTAVAITPDNRVAIHPVHSVQFAAWRGFETVIASGPHLLHEGRPVAHYASGYRDPAVFGRAARSALGIRSARTLVFLSSKVPLTPGEVAKIMRRAGARDAILLDGGSSTGLAWKGKTLYDSGRKIAYGIGVYANYAGQRYSR